MRVSSDGGRIRADGPRSRDDRWWNVQVEIETPRDTPLALTTRNGGIDIDFPVTVSGRLSSSRRRFDTPIGGGAPLRVRTTNGGVRIVRR